MEFDENKSTPEMVRQYGEMEKSNVLMISNDSVLTFISGGDTLRGRCSLRDHQVYCDGEPFGRIEDGVITTETTTPIGKIEVVYKK